MKNTLKVINYVLLGLALVAVGFGVFAFFQYRAVPIAEYESSAADLRAQAQLVDESTDKLSEEFTGCCFQSTFREYTKSGLRRVHKGIALGRKELKDGLSEL